MSGPRLELVTRGRPRKAQINDVVLVTPRRANHALPYYGVVVDLHPKGYVVIEADFLGRFRRGAAMRRDSTEIQPIGNRSVTPGRIYRKNVSPEERGCACQCCNHIAGFEED